MPVTALLGECPHPSDIEIREGLSGNFCRCIGYRSIVRLRRAAEMMSGSAAAVD